MVERKYKSEAIADGGEANTLLDTSEQWDPSTLELSNLEYPAREGHNDSNERVDDDENFEVDDVPFNRVDLVREKIHKNALTWTMTNCLPKKSSTRMVVLARRRPSLIIEGRKQPKKMPSTKLLTWTMTNSPTKKPLTNLEPWWMLHRTEIVDIWH